MLEFFLVFFWSFCKKKIFLAVTNFWTFLMSFKKKIFFFQIFIWKNHGKWYQWKNFSGIFLASVCPKEYKNGKIFDRPFFRPRGSISSTVLLLWVVLGVKNGNRFLLIVVTYSTVSLWFYTWLLNYKLGQLYLSLITTLIFLQVKHFLRRNITAT